jgi:hypothetical protein
MKKKIAKHYSVEIIERMTKVEVLLGNHLKHHEVWFSAFIAPMAVGVAVILVKLFMP